VRYRLVDLRELCGNSVFIAVRDRSSRSQFVIAVHDRNWSLQLVTAIGHQQRITTDQLNSHPARKMGRSGAFAVPVLDLGMGTGDRGTLSQLVARGGRSQGTSRTNRLRSGRSGKGLKPGFNQGYTA
jgi:hypothetical protein